MDGTVRLWDLASGKELQNFGCEKGKPFTIAFSPDLRLAASADQIDTTIRLWDTATGKEWKRLKRGGMNIFRLAFSPDGRTLLEAGGVPSLFLWEVCSGQLRRSVPLPGPMGTAAYSPDGRRIAVAEYQPGPPAPRDPNARDLIRILDLSRNRHVSSLSGHAGSIHALGFSPDSRTLASGSDDTTALLWDVGALDSPRQPVALTPDQRAACWADLAGGAERAYACMWKLVEDEGAVAYLRTVLRPVSAPPDAAVFARLLADLDSDQFAVRSRASEQLAALGPAAEGALRKALTDKRSAEVRRSLEGLLRALEGQRVRYGRAIEALEWMNTSEARRLLEALTRGAADAWLTQEAKISLQRLAGRPPAGR
jgi:WD40 repeat protein